MTKSLVRVEKLVPGGSGLIRLDDGQIAFVTGVATSERIEVEWLEKKKGVLRGRLLRVIESSRDRVDPACPIADACGGCDWLHLAYAAQLREKALLVRQALTRTGGFASLPAFEIDPSPAANHYRNRIRLHFGADGAVGFFAAESHRLVDVEACLVARPELNQGLTELRRIAKAMPELSQRFSEGELRVGFPVSEQQLHLVRRAPVRSPKPGDALLAELSQHFAVSVEGQPSLRLQRFEIEPSVWLQVPPEAFVQVNWAMNRRLVRRVVEGARVRGVRRFADLYAGVGNFSVALAKVGLSGVSVEGQVAASQASEQVLREQGLSSVTVVHREASAWLSDQALPFDYDFVVLDPPRAGARALLPALLSRRPGFIAYCSCDPVTLARDLRSLCQEGYALESIECFDMFPGTHHVETLVWLRHSDPATRSVRPPSVAPA